MVKVEVDKFRQQLLGLKILFHSLLDMNILSQSLNFTKRLEIIQADIEEIVTRSEVMTVSVQTIRK